MHMQVQGTPMHIRRLAKWLEKRIAATGIFYENTFLVYHGPKAERCQSPFIYKSPRSLSTKLMCGWWMNAGDAGSSRS